MKRTVSLLLVLLAFVLVPAVSFGAIQEVADKDGNVTHYKYTDKNGSMVFTDSLAKIPEEVRKNNKVVRVGPPKRKPAPVEQKAATEAAPPAEAPAPALPQYQVKPEAAPAPGGSSGGSLWLMAALVIAAGLSGYFAYRRVSGAGRPASRRAAGPPGRDRAPATGDGPRQQGRPSDGPGPRADVPRNPPKDRPEESLKRLIEARDFSAAAVLCESMGDLAQAAACHLESGNAARARELYLTLKDYRRAAELFEKAGDDLQAAELYEAAFQREGPGTRAAPGNDNALRSGRLFEKLGDTERAAGIYLKANLHGEAAALFEGAQDFLRAAESYLKADNPEKAAACFEKAGNPAKGYATLATLAYDNGRAAEAAAYSEKAGDLMQAATMYQEAGDFPKAGECFFRAGFFSEAAESFSLANDLPNAAAAYEQAGNYLQAAQIFETVGADRERLAALYEKGEDYYSAGRLFVKLGQLDRALNVLQQVDAASPNYPQASLLVGMIFLKRGLIEPASEKFLKIIDGQPIGKANLEPYYFLALCHEKAGDAEQAKSIFTRILAEDYNYRDVRARVAGP